MVPLWASLKSKGKNSVRLMLTSIPGSHPDASAACIKAATYSCIPIEYEWNDCV